MGRGEGGGVRTRGQGTDEVEERSKAKRGDITPIEMVERFWILRWRLQR